VKTKKITLLRPNMGDYRALDAFPPLVMGILAARTPESFEVRFYDDRAEEIPLDEPTDLVAMSVETFTARRAYHLADLYRKRGVSVVMGGHHPTLLPDEALRHADAVLSGDAEGVWEEFLEDFQRGQTRTLYHGGNKAAFESYKMDRSVFEGKKYAPVSLVQFGRGCRHGCDFCSIHAFYGSETKHHPVGAIVSEVAALVKKHPGRLLGFVDDNFYSSSAALTELLTAIRPLKALWGCEISADVIRDPGLMDLMAESGCRIALIGFESVNDDNLRAMKKDWTRQCGKNLDVVREFHSRGIGVCGTFIFGYDGDTPETIDATVDFVREARLELAQLNPLTPIPGTPFYQRLHSEGRILRPEWWIDPTYRYGDPIITPPKMAPEEFSRLCFEAKKRFYAWGTLSKRVFAPGAGFNLWNLKTFGIANLISRREVYRKQFRFLGA
jgi:radical SAM superfamily enzyme YgiQ (UPF0313 family)